MKQTTSLEFNEQELVLLTEHLGKYIVVKANSGVDTNKLPETTLRVKLIKARSEMVGH